MLKMWENSSQDGILNQGIKTIIFHKKNIYYAYYFLYYFCLLYCLCGNLYESASKAVMLYFVIKFESLLDYISGFWNNFCSVRHPLAWSLLRCISLSQAGFEELVSYNSYKLYRTKCLYVTTCSTVNLACTFSARAVM